MSLEGGSNPSTLCLVESKLAAKRGQEVDELCDRCLCLEVMVLWYSPRATCYAAYAGAYRGCLCASIYVVPCLLSNDPRVSDEVDEVLGLLRSRYAKDIHFRLFYLHCNAFRSIDTKDRCRFNSRDLRWIPPLCARYVKRYRGRFVSF